MIPEIREVEREEMLRLQPDEIQWPESSNFVGAFEEGKLVGRIGAMSVVHLEGTWVEEKYRKTMLPYRMFSFMEGRLKDAGLTHVLAFSASPVITDYLERLGYKEEKLTILSKEL